MSKCKIITLSIFFIASVTLLNILYNSIKYEGNLVFLKNVNIPLPSNSTFRFPKMPISVCVPAIAADIKSNLFNLLGSISAQTFLPREVVIVMSNVSTNNCLAYSNRLQSAYNKSRLYLKCVEKLQYQSISRQNASSIAVGPIISFIDADDIMFPERLEVIATMFQHYNAHMVLHGHTKSAKKPAKGQWKKAEITDGVKLFDIANKTVHAHAWILAEIMHSQVSVLKDVLKFVRYRLEKKFYRTEDSWFVRDVISYFGRKSNSAIFINTSLTTHIPREQQKG